MSDPLAYLITYTCYGQWLHGDERGSVDAGHRLMGEPFLEARPKYREASADAMTQAAYQLQAAERETCLVAIREVCRFREWRLWAAHIRSKHLHFVVTASVAPEKVMNDFKAYSSRALNTLGRDDVQRKRWTRHGSTRYINDESHLCRAIDYVLFKQGKPQTVYDGRNTDDPRSDDQRPSHEPRPSGSGEP